VHLYLFIFLLNQVVEGYWDDSGGDRYHPFSESENLVAMIDSHRPHPSLESDNLVAKNSYEYPFGPMIGQNPKERSQHLGCEALWVHPTALQSSNGVPRPRIH
jgi:hypothetical protein